MNFSVATWNINSIRMRGENLIEFLNIINPDILLLQETKCENDKFPHEVFEHLPYNIQLNGQKSYNGVAIFSKLPFNEVNIEFSENPLADQARFLEVTINAPIGLCRLISLYAPNGGEVNSIKFAGKLEFYDAFIKYVNNIKTYDEMLLIGGDFNIAPYDIDVYSPEALRNTTCFTHIEKAKYRSLLNSGFEDLYRLANPSEREFSWWDYRAGAFEQNKGMRIDTILSNAKAADMLKKCEIYYEARTKTKPSDHVPVIAYFGI